MNPSHTVMVCMQGLSAGVVRGREAVQQLPQYVVRKQLTPDVLFVHHEVSASGLRERDRGFNFSYRLWACHVREECGTHNSPSLTLKKKKKKWATH